MLSHEELVDLYRTLRDERVLSLYLDGRATDFSEKNVWRRRLDHEVQAARKEVNGASPDEVGSFDQALDLLRKELAKYDQYLPDRGWVGFATPEKVWYAESVRVPMPDLARWEGGIRVAPYVRALKQERPVLVLLVDRRRARFCTYRRGEIEEPENLLADLDVGDFSDSKISKRATTHSGVRGKTATDAAQRVLEVHSERLLRVLMSRLAELAGKDGLLVLGGTPEAVSSARSHLPSGVADRTEEVGSLHLDMSLAEIKKLAEEAASRINQRIQAEHLEGVINEARAGGRGALGREEVEKALQDQRVALLLLSRGFIRSNPDYADHLVGSAFEQHAEVEELSMDGGERLDAEGHGIGARLRYRVQE